MGSMGAPNVPREQSLNLPVIDVSDTSPENGKRLVQAAIDYGFLYVSPEGTPFNEQLIDAQFKLSREFFTCPLSEKEKFHVGTDNRGWLGMHNEILDPAKQSKEFKEAFNIGEFDEERMPQQIMPGCLSTETSLTQLRDFEAACDKTCKMFLDLIGIGLEVEDGLNWFSKRHGRPSGCTMRMLHYPSLPKGTDYSLDNDVRAGAHSDYGSITLLFQRSSQPGLEIRPPGGTDTWAPVAVFPPNYASSSLPPILVNIGDLMSYWTSGLLRSTVHRVIFPKDTKAGQDRYSLVYFCHPRDDVELEAVPSRIVREHKRRIGQADEDETLHGYGGGMNGKRAMTAREHLTKRLSATYSHRVERS
ncbi:hypothetical protein LTR64_002539 [Lithohypha guttulata]|uniref:uncharacterized protein n=1 Tax=Lithohypha guttulata TaxID=1690604 RepID=UPI002DDE05EA|nr:hypothetical protein LTR51_001235 [Lithohypha guttulata]